MDKKEIQKILKQENKTILYKKGSSTYTIKYEDGKYYLSMVGSTDSYEVKLNDVYGFINSPDTQWYKTLDK
jgi:hypothetical protein